MGSSRTCIVCGRQIPATRRKYCSARCCEKWNAEKRKGWKQEIDYKLLRKQVKKHKESGGQLARINERARKSGMTYGQYVAKMNVPVVRKHGE